MALVTLSMKALTWLSGTAPMKPSAGWPLAKAIDGRDRLDPHLARDSRMLVDIHLDQLDLALCGADRFSRIGVSWRHGPHHGAQSRSAPAAALIPQ
jgi:hypothetical protein